MNSYAKNHICGCVVFLWKENENVVVVCWILNEFVINCIYVGIIYELVAFSWLLTWLLLRCILSFRWDYMLRYFSCMIIWWFIQRRDDYFLFIYYNYMIYCFIKNRALHYDYNDFSPPPKSQSSSKGSIKFWYLVWCLLDFAVENLMWTSVRSQKLINMLIDWFGPVIHLPNQYANEVIAVGCIGNIY